jgi:hypothetical protein
VQFTVVANTFPNSLQRYLFELVLFYFFVNELLVFLFDFSLTDIPLFLKFHSFLLMGLGELFELTNLRLTACCYRSLMP